MTFRALQSAAQTGALVSRRGRLGPGGVTFADSGGVGCAGCVGCRRDAFPGPASDTLLADLPSRARDVAELDIVITVPARQLLTGAVVGHGLPTVLLVAGAFGGTMFDSAGGEIYSVCGALFGLIVGSWLLRLYDYLLGSQLSVSQDG